MIGSTKQIEWANNIINTWVSQITQSLQSKLAELIRQEQRYGSSVELTLWMQAAFEAAETIMGSRALAGDYPASKIIDGRKNNMSHLFSSQYIARAKALEAKAAKEAAEQAAAEVAQFVSETTVLTDDQIRALPTVEQVKTEFEAQLATARQAEGFDFHRDFPVLIAQSHARVGRQTLTWSCVCGCEVWETLYGTFEQREQQAQAYRDNPTSHTGCDAQHELGDRTYLAAAATQIVDTLDWAVA